MTDNENKFAKGARALKFQGARVNLVEKFAARDIFISQQATPNSDEM